MFTKDSKYLICGDSQGNLFCFNINNNFYLQYKKQIHSDWINDILPIDNDQIITCSYDKSIIITEQTKDLYKQGQILSQQNQGELAIQYYDLYISQNSDDDIAYIWKGLSLLKLKRYEEAIQMYDKAIQLNPQNYFAYAIKGNSLYDLKRYEEAIQMYDKAIQLNPQDSDVYSNKG